MKIMKTEMKKILESKQFLMVASLIAAILLWIYVIQVENPVFQLPMSDIPVKFENRAVLEEAGLMMTYSSADKVSMTISGRRKTVSAVDRREVTASVDLKNITEPGEYNMSVRVAFPENNISIADRRPKVKIKVEKIVSKKLSVKVSVEGEAAKGYYAAYTENPPVIEVSAPESMIDSISVARAVVNASGERTDFEHTVPLKLYDTEGNSLESPYIRMKQTYMDIKCKVYPTKKVPVTWTETGYSLNMSQIKPSVSSIEIAGSKETLDKISEINLGELYLLSLSPATPSKTFKLSDIPELSGVIVTKNIKEVTLTATFSSPRPEPEEPEDPEPVKTSATLGTISLSSPKEGMTVQLMTDSVKIDFMALPGTANHHVEASADISSLPEGEHDVPLIITASDDVKIIGNYTVKVKILPVTPSAEETEAEITEETEI